MNRVLLPSLLLAALAGPSAVGPCAAQDRLPSLPGYDQYQKAVKNHAGAYKSGAVTVTWKDGGAAFDYRLDDKTYRYTIDAGTKEEAPKDKPKEGKDEPKAKGPPKKAGPPRGAVERGRQFGSAASPDGKLRAFYKDRNLWLGDADGVLEMPVTTDGNEKARVKNGSASWVYGEELEQRTAMWWSPDSKKIAFYRFDEGGVPDYFLATGQTALMTKVDAEPYPKAGAPNPVVELLVYDVGTKKTTKVDVRDGKPFTDDVVGHYVYNVSWSPDGKELLFNRTNRLQNAMEFTAADPASGRCRVVVREEWPASWVENHPPLRFLDDGKRFLWISERTGFRNIYLYDLSGKLLATVTNHPFEVFAIARVDEAAGRLWYTARSGDNPMKLQLHRVGLDGSKDVRLTDPAFTHNVDIAPDGKHVIDTYTRHDAPASTRLIDADGRVLFELAKGSLAKYEDLGLKPAELLTFKAADGQTDLYGLLQFPSNFDPKRKYPLLVSVYAGPGTNGARETFVPPSTLAEYGFLVASFDARSAAGRGKKFLDAIYRKLGVTEIDDLAAGVKSLYDRPYLDKGRVGIYGTSYGGYASVMCLLRHPDVFRAASAASPVTDWKLYDSIYTERYMGLPADNTSGYAAGSALPLAKGLKGRLMLFFGTADNNVHPSNSLQLIQALQRAGKSFEVQVGPDQGHAGINPQRMMEFFIEALVTGK